VVKKKEKERSEVRVVGTNKQGKNPTLALLEGGR
jgi:hypothetical protein